MKMDRDLNRIRLDEAGRCGFRFLTITEGERLSLMAAEAYRSGWVLKGSERRGRGDCGLSEGGAGMNVEDEERMATIRKTAAALATAIESGDWTTAREIWTWFKPLYPDLFALDPKLAHVEKALQQNEAFAGPQVGGIH